jgi:hypothetical protein
VALGTDQAGRSESERPGAAGGSGWVVGTSGTAGNNDDPATIGALVRALGETGRRAAPQEIARLRHFFADRVLPTDADPHLGSIVAYVTDKFREHAREWPRSATVGDYLASLRATVRYQRGGLRLYQHPTNAAWMLMFVGPARQWRGAAGGPHIVVLFNGERVFWVTGFQPPRSGLRYAANQGGQWLKAPG